MQKCLEFREALPFRQTSGLPGEPVVSQPLVTDQALDFREATPQIWPNNSWASSGKSVVGSRVHHLSLCPVGKSRRKQGAGCSLPGTLADVSFATVRHPDPRT